jgi:hypothetical protein
MKISKKNPFEWFVNNFGIGGFINYTEEQRAEILEGLKMILRNCGYVEAEFIGKFLIKLSDDPEIWDKFIDALEV